MANNFSSHHASNLHSLTGSEQIICNHNSSNYNLKIDKFWQNQTLIQFCINHSSAAIAIFDCNMRYIYASQRWRENYGITQQDIVGQYESDVCFQVQPTSPNHPYNHKVNAPRCEENCFVRADGNLEWLRREIYPWYENDQTLGGSIIFSEVITATKRLQQHISIQNALVNLSNQSQGWKDASRQFLSSICLDLQWDLGELWVYNRCTEKLDFSTNYYDKDRGYTEFTALSLNTKFSLGEGLIGKVQQIKAPVWIDNVSEDTLFVRREIAAKIGLRSALAFPIICDRDSQGQVVGVMTLFSHQQRPQDPYLLQEMINAGQQLGQFIDRKRMESELQSSQQLLRLVIDNIPQAIFWKDRNSVYLGCNRNFADDAGIGEPESIIGKTDYDLPWTREEADFYREYDKKVMETGIPELHVQETQQQADGQHSWLDTNKIPLRDLNGKVIGVLGCYEDITQRQQAEAKLREQEEFLRSLYDGVELLIFVVNVLENGDLRYAGWNLPTAKATGVSNQDVINKSPQEVFGTSQGEKVYQRYQSCIQTGKSITYEECLNFDGTDSYWLTTINPLKDSDGNIYRLVGTTFNITERKQAEDELKASQRFVERIANSSPSLLYIYDLQKQCNIYANRRMTDFLGYSDEEIKSLGANLIATIIHPEDSLKMFEQVQKVMNAQDGEVLEVEYRLRHADNTWHWIYDRTTPFNRDKNGHVTHAVGVATDITERKQAEIELQQQKQDLQTTLEELQRTQTQLIQSEKMSSLGQMVAGVAHEINNPANFIHGNLYPACEYSQNLLSLLDLYQKYYPEPPVEIQTEIEAIDLEFIKEDLPKLFTSMQEGTRRIREIVLSLRNFSRLDEAEYKQADIHEGIENTLLILQNRLKAKQNHPEIQVIKNYTQIPLVSCFPGQLNQVFMNILANAIDAIEQIPHPCITIITQVIDNNYIQIQIADNGTGISSEIIAKLFDPFFTTKEVGKGTGLGLSISYQIIVDKHKGKLFCQSSPQNGTKFIIEIPINPSQIHQS